MRNHHERFPVGEAVQVDLVMIRFASPGMDEFRAVSKYEVCPGTRNRSQ